MMSGSKRSAGATALLLSGIAWSAMAADIGQVKVVKGPVTVERAGQVMAAAVGMRVSTADIVRTGASASVGITLIDDTLLSAGPNSVLTLDRVDYEPSTQKGRLDATLGTGTLAVVSGRIAKQSPDAMTVRTPFAVLGVRGTEFAVSAHEPVLASP
jgi:hypothetical protein